MSLTVCFSYIFLGTQPTNTLERTGHLEGFAFNLGLWTFGLIGEWKWFQECFKSGTHEMFKIRVDLKFQILVPVLM
ncbi:hypothetical protein RhiirA4_541200 [Rhizophagus irregularis]|uniref:Uncharacterized protein n=1 Tax=Rhizophagus irregularis TaxID=588596 RepID=A0A2I1GAA7_9GLOM|nr:hypothetical protein RhiirA4_541200 [Rhizophagus irregularis]